MVKNRKFIIYNTIENKAAKVFPLRCKNWEIWEEFGQRSQKLWN